MSAEIPTVESKVESGATPSEVIEEQKPITAPTQATASTSASVPAKEGPVPVSAASSSALAKLMQDLPAIVQEAEHDEMWGVTLTDSARHIPTAIVLEKFLRANAKDVPKARAQLVEALKWRKRMQPAKLLDAVYDAARFADLGFVTVYPAPGGDEEEEERAGEIITWNIYGAVKDIKATFGDVDEFIRWRSAIMELSVRELDLASATEPIPEDGPDPYRMVQVHDYLNVSFLRMDPTIRAATKEVISTFSMAYPELLKEKFFVNVPLVMGWVFAAIKVFLAPETVKKFHPLSYGGSLAGELKDVGTQLPEAYGGKGKDLKSSGLTVRYTSAKVERAEVPAQTA